MSPATWMGAAAVLIATCLAPLRGHSRDVASQDAAERVLRRVDEALARNLEQLRRAILEDVRRELSAWKGASLSGDVDKALELITADLLRRHAEYLAGDELEGRNSGYPGNDKAAEYVTGVMKRCGLAPAGDQGEDGAPTYFQAFKVAGRTTRNCLGFLEGTDPVLKKEILVVGAHHDHVGTADQRHWGRLGREKGDDSIWNGADDNASGTSTVLGLIRAFGEGGLRTKRSILFMTFSGEEGGLLGSRWYVNHPSFPLSRHVFMLNLDMVGRNPDRPVEIHGVGSAEGGAIRRAAEAAVRKADLKADIKDGVEITGGDSDHSSFRDKGIPFTFFFTGFHADYHRVTDHADRLAYDHMVKIGKASAHLLLELGQAEARPTYRQPRFDGIDPPKAGRRLGIQASVPTDEEYESLGLAASEGALKVDLVASGSVAEQAGLEAGDYVVALDGRRLKRSAPREDLIRALEMVKPDRETEIEIIRGGKRVKLKGTWDK
ncbi:MAG: M20/M25/M40 family metallo-hydrolase [Planctomycetes bacterium]|nr:M20/M25/M40 family metallo-hydrolase [Planctomycetota bacterium]